MKHKLIQFLASIGKRHKWLTIPVVGIMVVFLTVYHSIKKFFFDVKYHKQRMRALTVAVSFAVVFSLIVLPSLAEETKEGDQTVYVEATEPPLITEAPDEEETSKEQEQPFESQIPITTVQPQNDNTGTAVASSEPANDFGDTEYKEEDTQTIEDTQDSGTTYEQGDSSEKKKQSEQTKRYLGAGDTLTASKPNLSMNVAELDAAYGKINESANEMKVQATAGDTEGTTSFTYQWKVNDTASASGAQNVNGENDTFQIPEDIDAGVYYYFCEVTAIRSLDGQTASAADNSAFVKVTVSRAPLAQTLTDHTSDVLNYDLSDVFYDGNSHGIGVSKKDSYAGIGNVTVYYKAENGTETTAEPSAVGTYDVSVKVAQGTNYEEVTTAVDIGTLTIKYWIPSQSYSVDGTVSGTDDSGAQWYKENVVLRPPTGCKISKTESDFAESIVIAEGEQHIDKVYLQKNPEGYISEEITVDMDYNVDLTEPSSTIKFQTNTVNSILNAVTGGGSAFKETQKVTIDSEDDGSGVKNIYYYSTTEGTVNFRSLSEDDWTPYAEFNITATQAESTNYYIYAKVVDYAGNIGYESNEDIILDSVNPEFRIDNNIISSEKKYVSDSKTLNVSDSNLSSITVKRADAADAEISAASEVVAGYTIIDKNGKKEASLNLTSPNGTGGVYKYFVTAVDASGNTSDIVVVMADPVSDITINNIVFDNQSYGYEDDSIEAKGFVCEEAAGYTEPDPPNITSIELLEVEDTDFAAFTIVDGTKIKPVNRLHAGSYSAKVRVNYNTDSSILSTCSIQVLRSQLNVEYRGQDVWYHTTNPDFSNYIYVSGFKYDESPDDAEHMPLSYIAPVITDFTGPAVTLGSQKLTPGGGQAADYVFAYTDGYMNVVRRASDKYSINGTKGSRLEDESDVYWYTDPEMTIRPDEGYMIGTDDADLSAFSEQGITIGTDTVKNQCDFYILNISTGEISNQISFVYGKDSTEPTGSITIEESSLRSVLNTITFGKLFRDTVNVDIEAMDDISDIAKVEYGVSENALDGTSLKAYSRWQEGDSFQITSEQAETVYIYGKITNGAGLVSYISSGAIEFDAEDPDISGVAQNGSYTADNKQITVTDKNLSSVKLYEGTDTSGTGVSQLIDTVNGRCVFSVSGETEAKTYTVLAEDATGNQKQVTFSVTKPVYDVSLNDKDMGVVAYGYTTVPSTVVDIENKGNASIEINDISLGDDEHFALTEAEENVYEISAVKGLEAGEYSTKVIIFYNGGSKLSATYSLTVSKATLKAAYKGDNVNYNMIPDMSDKLEVTGFVNGETPASAAGYETPSIEFDGPAKETTVITPKKGRADNYSFEYVEGVLNVVRNTAEKGTNGQYVVNGTRTDTGWFNSDITIKPNAGYAICKKENSNELLDQITLTDDTDDGQLEFYIKNTSTGEMYKKTVFLYMKDAVNPAITGVDNGASYSDAERTVTVTDAYLASVTVNGTAQAVTNGSSTFTLTAGTSDMVYVIVARDRAGNTVDKSVTFGKTTASVSTNTSDSNSDLSADAQGRINKKVVIVSGAPTVSITSSASDLAKAVLTKKEIASVSGGKNAQIVLKVKNIDSTVSQSEKELIIANLKGYTLGQYLDMTMFKSLDDEDEKQMTNLNSNISTTINIPEKLLSNNSDYTRLFAMVCVHNGKASFLKDQDSVSNTLTVFTKKYSTYALVYKDVKNNGNSSDKSQAGGNNSSASNQASTGESPATGDTLPLNLLYVVLSLSLVGIIICVIVIIKKRGRKSA